MDKRPSITLTEYLAHLDEAAELGRAFAQVRRVMRWAAPILAGVGGVLMGVYASDARRIGQASAVVLCALLVITALLAWFLVAALDRSEQRRLALTVSLREVVAVASTMRDALDGGRQQ